MINRLAVFSDETENFVKPYAPNANDSVEFKIRVGKKDFEKVTLCFNDEEHVMDRIKSKGIFEFFVASLVVAKNSNYYYILDMKDGTRFYYNRFGLVQNLDRNFDFKIVTDFKVPEWAKGAVMYQIFIDRFANGDKSNDVETNEYMYRGKEFIDGQLRDKKEFVERVTDWYEHPHAKDNTRFYGGDLKGILDKLDYLSDLGIDVIYFNPIFVSPSNHRYDTQDYDYVDPHIGEIVEDAEGVLNENAESNTESAKYTKRVTDFKNLEASNELLRRVIEEAHSRGMKVILDGVFNHCGSFNKWLDREKIYMGKEGYENGAFIDKDSPYSNYFKFNSSNWPYNLDYDRWWGFEELPKLNYEGSRELFDYILNVGKKWVSEPYNADGWRLDVAADLGFSREFNHKFWKEFRASVKEGNPNAIILAEHYEDAYEWLCGDEWDTIMNYEAFMEPISYFLTGMEKHSDASKLELYGDSETFINTMNWFQGRMPIQSIEVSMNQLSNHDHSRFMTRTNRSVGRIDTRGANGAACGINKGIYKEATVMQMTWPGAPTLYYGDEAGVVGWTDPDSRRPYPWGREDNELLCFTREIIKIHKRFDVLKKGSLMYLVKDYNLLAYARFNEEEKVIVLLNNNDNNYHMEITIPVWRVGIQDNTIMKVVFRSDISSYSTNEEEVKVIDGEIRVKIDAFSTAIISI